MKDLLDTAVDAGRFKTLIAAVNSARLTDTFKGDGPFTLFAPTDAAFDELPPGTTDALLKDAPKLKVILTYHIVEGKMPAFDLAKLDSRGVTTMNGAELRVSAADGVRLNDTANVTQTDLECTNGVMHVIDAILLPPA